jgi:pilus assembly protein Flp/PilA
VIKRYTLCIILRVSERNKTKRTKPVTYLNTRLKTTKKAKKGQSLAEYGLITGLIAIVCIGALTTLGTQIKATLAKVEAGVATGTAAIP